MTNNNSDDEQEVIILPDGRIDIVFTVSSVGPYRVMLMVIRAEANLNVVLPSSKTFNYLISQTNVNNGQKLNCLLYVIKGLRDL